MKECLVITQNTKPEPENKKKKNKKKNKQTKKTAECTMNLRLFRHILWQKLVILSWTEWMAEM